MSRALARLRGRRHAAPVFVALAFAAVSCAVLSSTATAAFRHTTPPSAFGADGTASSTIDRLGSLAFDQTTHRLYAQGQGRYLFAFEISPTGVATPVAGFPVPIPEYRYYGQLAVDNSATASAGHVLSSRGNGFVDGFTASGAALPGFPIATPGQSETCGVAVDASGHIWLGDYAESAILEYEADGTGPIKTVSTKPTGGNPCNVAVDPSNGDLYAEIYSGGVWRFTASSNYATATQLDDRYQSKISFDSSRGFLYDGYENVVRSYPRTGTGLIEQFGNPASRISSTTVEESSGTVFVADAESQKIEEWRGANVPLVTTNAPSGNSTLAGQVDPDGAGKVEKCFFEYGLTTSYGQTAQCEPAPPLASKTNVTAKPSDLIGDKTYHYRLVAANASGSNHGVDQTITPHNVDGLKTEPATAITRQTATLHGSFNGTNDKTQYYFEYGLTEEYGEDTTVQEAGATTGTTPLSAAVEELEAGATYHFRAVAINTKGKSQGADETFTTNVAVKGLRTLPAAEIGPTEATLSGELDPDGYSTTYYFQYGRTTSYGFSTPAPPGAAVGATAPGPVVVSTRSTGLEPGVTYHFRIVAVNATGTTEATDDQTFTTRQGPSIEAVYSSGVTATSAVLDARINPQGDATTYYFEYGPTTDYGSTAPVPPGTLPAGYGGVPLEIPIQGLRGSLYHFRVVAKNSFGTTISADQTFTFNPPECPNANVRQLTGSAFLPDCRAYELVSPPEVGGVLLNYEAPNSAYATSPPRFAYSGQFGSIEGTGEPQGVYADLYVATRTPNGWVSKYVGIPGNQGTQTQGPPNIHEGVSGQYANLDMSEVMNWDTGQYGYVCCGQLGSFAPFLWSAEGASLGRLPTNVAEVPKGLIDYSKGGFFGAVEPTPDFRHYFFSSNNAAFAPGALTTAPGAAYDNNRATGEVNIVSITPQGGPILQDPGVSGSKLEKANEFIKFPAVSPDGSHILMSTRAANFETHLYMRVDDSRSYDVSLGSDGQNHGVTFEGMSGSGEQVYFTSSERLTSEDTDSSRDLYMWSEKSAPAVTLISKGTNGTGNRDDCNTSWTSGCNASVVNINNRFTCCANPRPTDNAVVAETGEVYFYSPELLDNGRGAFGERNLYVYREGRPMFVATLGEGKEVNRIQVTPDGTYAALVTGQSLTAYDSGGHLEMYRYEPGARTFDCASCIPDGSPPKGNVVGSENGIFLTNDGRAFYSTTDSLVPKDSDGLIDTYEYVDHRPQLISTGTSEYALGRFSATGFIGVSANGTDAYFTTLDTLVKQDQNGAFYKFYDARTNGGFSYAQTQAPCEAADECHGPGSSPRAAAAEGTAADLGRGGNVRHRKHHRKKHNKHVKHGKKKGAKNKAGAAHHKSQRGHR